MEYFVDITKKDLLELKPLKSEFRKELIGLNKFKKEFLKNILIMSIIMFLIIIFLENRYSHFLDPKISIILILLSYVGFSLISLSLIFLELLSVNKLYILKYSHLLNKSKIIIKDNQLMLEKDTALIKINLTDCSLIKYDNTLILNNSKNFKVILPITKIKSGDNLELELKEIINGKTI